jgi:hypothetical protein
MSCHCAPLSKAFPTRKMLLDQASCWPHGRGKIHKGVEAQHLRVTTMTR